MTDGRRTEGKEREASSFFFFHVLRTSERKKNSGGEGEKRGVCVMGFPWGDPSSGPFYASSGNSSSNSARLRARESRDLESGALGDDVGSPSSSSSESGSDSDGPGASRVEVVRKTKRRLGGTNTAPSSPVINLDVPRKSRRTSLGQSAGGTKPLSEDAMTVVAEIQQEHIERANRARRQIHVVEHGGSASAPLPRRARQRETRDQVDVIDLSDGSVPLRARGSENAMSRQLNDAALARQLQLQEDTAQVRTRAAARRLRSSESAVRRVDSTKQLVVFPWDERGQAQSGSVSLTEGDLALLQPGNQLNDNLIDFYLTYVWKKLMPERHRSKCHFFTTFFFSALKKRGSEYVQRWVRGINLFEKQFLVIPINEADHWKVVVVVSPKAALECAAVSRQRTASPPLGSHLLMFDSLGSNANTAFGTIRRWLADEYELRNGLPPKSVKFGPKSIRGVEVSAPTQPNDYDCGVYLLLNMERFCRDLDQDVEKITPDWFAFDDIEEQRVRFVGCIQRLGNQLNALRASLVDVVEQCEESTQNSGGKGEEE
jgi:Ulp1 protease family, C-terminal catalytic domain